LVAILVATGAYGGHRLDRASMEIALHAPGPYYFARLRGGAVGPFQPKDEIAKADALASGHYVIGTYDEQGRLIAIEKRSGGEQIFRVEYGYDEAGKIYEVRR
jgi:YD repeat-containing protein